MCKVFNLEGLNRSGYLKKHKLKYKRIIFLKVTLYPSLLPKNEAPVCNIILRGVLIWAFFEKNLLADCKIDCITGMTLLCALRQQILSV